MAGGYLVLEDGTLFEGELFGKETESDGEVVFATGMSGYQESLTDPSYRGQVIVMTYPLIGNYGVTEDYFVQGGCQARGLVVREYCRDPSPMYNGRTLDEYLRFSGIPGISEIDTRELTLKIRNEGTMKGRIVPEGADIDKVVAELKAMPLPEEGDLVAEVSVRETGTRDNGKADAVGILDLGAKKWIAEALSGEFNTVVFPYDTPADAILASGVRGLLVSEGPGNPAHPAMGPVADTVREVAGRMPVFGIGLGCEVLARAFGAGTYKLKFGHRGANQPVKYGGRVYMTSQNHGYSVDADSLAGTGLEVEQVNVNDGTVEGFRHASLPVFGSLHQPDRMPAPWDGDAVLGRFVNAVKEGKL